MTCGVNENGYSTRLLVPLLQPSQNDFAPSNTVRYYLNGHRQQQRLATLRERSEDDIALGARHSRNAPSRGTQTTVLTPIEARKGTFSGLRTRTVMSSAVLEKTLGDTAPDLT